MIMQNIIKYKFETVDLVYYLFALLRIILTLVLQKGYIHPDEFFQSIEIMAGEVFEVESDRPWEFNNSYPIRSIFTPYAMVGIPYKVLNLIDTNFRTYLNLNLKTPYWLLIFPRLFFCLLTFVIDYCMYQICKINSEKFRNKLLILASSFVIQVYGTRTFSNTIEMILMAILLHLVVESQTFSHEIIQKNVYLTQKYKRSHKPMDRARIYKMKASLPSHTMKNCMLISLVVITGIFNRPTFIAFAFPSVFFWIHRGIGLKMVRYSDIHYRMLLFVLNSVIFVFVFIIIDSFYFGYLSVAEIWQMDISLDNFVVTPLNFLKYNMDIDQLKNHGLHPRITHLLVNIPLLYNILGLIGIGGVVMLVYRLACGQFTELPRIHSIRFLMSTSIIVPIAVLSYFPHQEPRFLIPVTLPLIYLYADVVTNKKFFLRLWWALNATCLLFFGFIHQAGVVSLAVYMNTQLNTQIRQPLHLVTSHVYSFPISLLMQQNTQTLYNKGSTKYVIPKSFFLYEMGSSQSTPAILQRLYLIHHIQDKQNNSVEKIGSDDFLIYLALPISKEKELFKYINDTTVNLGVEKIMSFYPHISTEAMPDIFYDPCVIDNESINEDCNMLSISYMSTFLLNFLKSCGLGLYKVYINASVTI